MLIGRKTHPLWCIYTYFLKIFININNFCPNSILKMQIFQASCHHCTAQRSQYHTVGLVLENRFVVQLLSCVRLFATPWVAAHQASLSFTIFWSLLKLMSIESVMLSNHFILYCPILLLPSMFPSIRVFSSEFALSTRWPKYWHFKFSISPSKDHSGLISFRIDWFDLFAVQETLKSHVQHHNSNRLLVHFYYNHCSYQVIKWRQ